MSPEIATTSILSNYLVTLKEENDKFLQDGIGRVRANLQSSVNEGKMSEKDFKNTISTLKGVFDYESFKDMDMVIELCFPCCPAQPLLEIVQTKQTSPQVVVDLLDVVEKIKKTPVVVGDCTGFVVNKMLFPYAQAATLLVERGADLNQIDRAITEFGMPMGPFKLADMVGFDVHNFPERSYKSALIPLI